MNRDDIIRMAIECQLITTGNRDGIYMDALIEFASLVAAAEREECARVAEECLVPVNWDEIAEHMIEDYEIAAAIRARGETA